VRDQASHTYTATDKIKVIYILLFIFFSIENWKTKDPAPNESTVP